ncbi:MAG: exodeoxyribonuclease VII small subunit [Chloroflexota bacterium]
MTEQQNFEMSFLRLQETIAALEQGGLPLDEAIVQFELGIQIATQCRAMLDAAELRVTRLIESDLFDETPGLDEDDA